MSVTRYSTYTFKYKHLILLKYTLVYSKFDVTWWPNMSQKKHQSVNMIHLALLRVFFYLFVINDTTF